MLFEKTAVQERQLQSFAGRLEEICRLTAPYGDLLSLEAIEETRQNFRRKAEDFFRQDRKFNLAVIGQVKAGKSSFLNTLLFGGQEILPRDSTPKTAALTRMEYAPQNRLTVEYYTPSEWDSLLERSSSDKNSRTAQAARELLLMADCSGVDVLATLRKGSETFVYGSLEEMMGRLEDYVGEKGRFTPLAKCVTLGLCNESLREISVVDTPGLNDPMPSRTERTRQFIETCDAAFFLSRSSYFLDENDMELLTSQLPQKGISRLFLVASQYDSALMDTISDFSSLQEADLQTRVQLMRHAAKSVDSAVTKMRRDAYPEPILEVLEQCRRPVFLSSMAHRMAEKSPDRYSSQEQLIFRNLSLYKELSADELKSIGNFDEIQSLFFGLAEQKDQMLERKAAGFVMTAQADLRNQLSGLFREVDGMRQRCSRERSRLTKRLTELSARNSCLRGEIDGAFEEYAAPLPKLLSDALFLLREEGCGFSGSASKADISVRNTAYQVSDAKFYKPWTWGKTHREYTAEQMIQEYQDTSEALNEIQLLQTGAVQMYDSIYSSMKDTVRLQNRLLSIAGGVYTEEGKPQDSGALRDLSAKAISYLVPPRLLLDFSVQRQQLTARFPGRVISAPAQAELKEAAAAAIEAVLSSIAKAYDNSSQRFITAGVQPAREKFCELLLEPFAKELNGLLQTLSETDSKAAQLQEIEEILRHYL